VTITRRGKPAAVLLSVDDLESLEETLYWQASRASTMTSRLLVGRPTPAS
jgi:PHD/YefM family antitoxin component YafN of YafNO toxin-antitoxin module